MILSLVGGALSTSLSAFVLRSSPPLFLVGFLTSSQLTFVNNWTYTAEQTILMSYAAFFSSLAGSFKNGGYGQKVYGRISQNFDNSSYNRSFSHSRFIYDVLWW
jgi:hypothetical protein